MQAMMLAAGMGKRLGRYTKDNTKCMVPVSGKTLLERACEALKEAGINKLILVTGYREESLIAFAKEKIKDIELVFVSNPDYNTTNNIYSLYLAKDYLVEDDTILLESDLIYETDLIKKMLDDPRKDLAAVALYEPWMDGTVTLLDENGYITDFIDKKNFDFSKTDKYYKTVNIYKLSKEFSEKKYVNFLESYIKAYGMNQYYELVLKAIIHSSEHSLSAYVLDKSIKWYEIDDGQDLDIATAMFASGKEKLNLFKKRFGGYWRFPGLLDYCYLVNPYFPTPQFMEKMKYSFDELVRQYPSSLAIENLIAARMFSATEDKILVGNGAAELINSLKSVIKGRIAVPIPTFNEYIRCFDGCDFLEIDMSKYDYSFNKEALIDSLELSDALVIINPDNPSGSFLKKEDALEIIEAADKLGKFVIFDESFIDFADKDLKYSLIDDEILVKYKKLIVIKSISKSYGVPGLRLGVLASGDEEIIKTVKAAMPVWNINSIAECFLQNIAVYKSAYTEGCEKLADERTRFIKKLEDTGLFSKVYPSEANFILCKTNDKITSEEIAEKLLEKANIFIKDLSDKNGFSGQSFIRLAVRATEENDRLIETLKSL